MKKTLFLLLGFMYLYLVPFVVEAEVKEVEGKKYSFVEKETINCSNKSGEHYIADINNEQIILIFIDDYEYYVYNEDKTCSPLSTEIRIF